VGVWVSAGCDCHELIIGFHVRNDDPLHAKIVVTEYTLSGRTPSGVSRRTNPPALGPKESKCVCRKKDSLGSERCRRVSTEGFANVETHNFNLGSNASRRPSPSILNPRTLAMIANPGNITTQGATSTKMMPA